MTDRWQYDSTLCTKTHLPLSPGIKLLEALHVDGRATPVRFLLIRQRLREKERGEGFGAWGGRKRNNEIDRLRTSNLSLRARVGRYDPM